jgi:hypothetical protein
MTERQIEFPLPVAVCAWCKPKEQGTGAGVSSHGICLRHLKKLKLEARGVVVRRLTRSRSAALREAEGANGALPLPC